MAVLLAVGSQAPDFRLPATTGDTVALSHYRGKRNLILVFYVGDNTPDCNRQLASLQEERRRSRPVTPPSSGSILGPWTTINVTRPSWG